METMDRNTAATLLGVSVMATPRQVRSAFRKRVRRDHPDRSGRDGTDFQRLVDARDLMLEPAPEPEVVAKSSSDTSFQKSRVAPDVDLSAYRNRPTPKKTELTYGYDPNARGRWDPEPLTSRSPRDIAEARGRTQRAPLSTRLTLVLVALFALVVIVGLALA